MRCSMQQGSRTGSCSVQNAAASAFRHHGLARVCCRASTTAERASGPGGASTSGRSEHVHPQHGAYARLERLYRLSGHLLHPWGNDPLLAQTPLVYAVTETEKRPEGASEQAKKGQPPRDPRDKGPDYYANVGDAIRTLRDDIPCLFQRDLNYEIYRDDVVFKDPRNSFSGIKNYRTIFWSLRFHGRIFFTKLYVDVRRIWQPPNEENVIKMRWTVHGIPRVPWEAEGVFDGISTYKLDGNGRIYEHQVDNVILRDPPMQGVPLLTGLNLVPGAPEQTPCPGAWFDGSGQGEPAWAASHGSLDWERSGPGPNSSGGSGCGSSAALASCRSDRAAGRQASSSALGDTASSTASAAEVASGGAESSSSTGGGSHSVGHSSRPVGTWRYLSSFSWVRLYVASLQTLHMSAGGRPQPVPLTVDG